MIPRYFGTDADITIKCRKCQQFGHMQRECFNDRPKRNCDFCGSEAHLSFECDQQMCFKCNNRGHKSFACTTEITEKC